MVEFQSNRRSFLKSGATLAAGVMTTATRCLFSQTKRWEPGGVLLYSGWAIKNIGDIGHTPGTLRYLEEYCPGVPVTLWLHSGSDAVIEMLRRRFPRLPIVQGRLDGRAKASTLELQDAFDACRFFLHNSGMHFNRFWRPPKHLLTSCLERNKPFGLYGQSFDPFKPEDQNELVELLSKAAFIFTRDTESLYYLRRIGVRPDVLEFGPDGCFGIDVRDYESADRFLAEHQLEPQKFITVTIRTHTRGDTIESLDPEQDERWSAKLRQIIIDWVQSTGKKVLLAPEVEKEIAAARRFLLEKLPGEIRENVMWRDRFWNVDEAVSVYSRAHTVISMEPHSCIMALAAGTPAIHYFTRKHGFKAWMFRDIGLPEWLFEIDVEPAENVSDAVAAIRRDYSRAKRRVSRAMNFVNRRSEEMIRVLRNHVT